MTLIDFGHLSSRILHTAVLQVNPKVDKTLGKFNTNDWASMYVHLLLKNLSYLKMKFEAEYGEIVICVDNKENWRKDVYPDYKGNRAKKRSESNIDYNTFYELQDDILNELDLNFPFKVIKVDKCEADDIVGVLAKEYAKYEKTVVVSSDKDFKQVLEYGAKLFDPIAKVFVNMSSDELKEWKIEHILGGDDGDNIPNIKQHTEFTEEFRKYLGEAGVYKDIPVHEFLEMKMADDLFKKYNIYEVYTAGKLKGQLKDTKKIFKMIPFGEKNIYKFAKNLNENLNSNILYKKYYDRNSQLVLFENIPTDIKNTIIEKVKVVENKYNPSGIMNLFSRFMLIELMKSASDFYYTPKQTKNPYNSPVNEWL